MQVPENEPIPYYDVPVPGPDEKGLPRWDLMDASSGQDIAMWATQGAIADRESEFLGRSDAGIIAWRRILTRELRTIADGGAPKKWAAPGPEIAPIMGA